MPENVIPIARADAVFEPRGGRGWGFSGMPFFGAPGPITFYPMEIIDVVFPKGLAGDFYCPLTGVPALTEDGELGLSCIGYIPPLAFHDAIIKCPHFDEYWERTLLASNRVAIEEDLSGALVQEILEAYDSPKSQKLMGFRIETTSNTPRVAPEFDAPIHTVAAFYIIDFWCDLSVLTRN
jgi:hypothetical protein